MRYVDALPGLAHRTSWSHMIRPRFHLAELCLALFSYAPHSVARPRIGRFWKNSWEIPKYLVMMHTFCWIGASILRCWDFARGHFFFVLILSDSSKFEVVGDRKLPNFFQLPRGISIQQQFQKKVWQRPFFEATSWGSDDLPRLAALGAWTQ